MQNAASIINGIINSNNLFSFIGESSDYNTIIKEYLSIIHPDICKEPNANEATIKLLGFKEEIECGFQYVNAEGFHVSQFHRHIIVDGDDRGLTSQSYKIYRQLISGIATQKDIIMRYFPDKIEEIDKYSLNIAFKDRAIPLFRITPLPQVHVNWIVSRMLELAVLFENNGYVFGAFNPDIIFAAPSTHGIMVTSFLCLARKGSNMKYVSSKYASLVNASLLKKPATSTIDVEMIKRTAAYLLGDKSGSGVSLRKTHNEDYINFILKYDDRSAFEVFVDYRKMLEKNFPKQFYKAEF